MAKEIDNFPIHCRIAHISDLHFGSPFSDDLWTALFKKIKNQSPDVIAISGDLVDFPRPKLFRKAKNYLTDLANASNAELFIVPGNHDIGLWGNVSFGILTRLPFKAYFELKFHTFFKLPEFQRAFPLGLFVRASKTGMEFEKFAINMPINSAT